MNVIPLVCIIMNIDNRNQDIFICYQTIFACLMMPCVTLVDAWYKKLIVMIVKVHNIVSYLCNVVRHMDTSLFVVYVHW